MTASVHDMHLAEDAMGNVSHRPLIRAGGSVRLPGRGGLHGANVRVFHNDEPGIRGAHRAAREFEGTVQVRSGFPRLQRVWRVRVGPGKVLHESHHFLKRAALSFSRMAAVVFECCRVFALWANGWHHRIEFGGLDIQAGGETVSCRLMPQDFLWRRFQSRLPQVLRDDSAGPSAHLREHAHGRRVCQSPCSSRQVRDALFAVFRTTFQTGTNRCAVLSVICDASSLFLGVRS